MNTVEAFSRKLLLLIHKRSLAAEKLKKMYDKDLYSCGSVSRAEASVDYWTRRIRNMTEPPIIGKNMDYDTR